MSAFFHTREFIFFKELQIRVSELNTENNYKKYKEILNVCKKIALENHQNIGWTNGIYSWVNNDLHNKIEESASDFLVCLGDEDGLSFYPGHTLYMNEKRTRMALKDGYGKVCNYTEEETAELKSTSIKNLKKIHDAKLKFEGRVLNSEEKREYISRQDKEAAKSKRKKLFY